MAKARYKTKQMTELHTFLSPQIYLHSIITASHLPYPSCELFRHNV